MEKGYNLIDTSRMLGIKVSTARYWARIGKIHAQKIAGTRRWIVMESEIKRLQNNVTN
jgi:predicted site-specific integrase-resolvase